VKLINGKDTVYFDDNLNKTICSRREFDANKEKVEFSKAVLLKDTVLAEPHSYSKFERMVRYNFTIHYGQSMKKRVKIPINSIFYIKQERAGLKLVTGSAIVCSLISALIVAPLVSIGNPYKTNTYQSIANPSIAIFATALAVNLVWGNKYYYIQKHKHKKIWKIE
jgi:hypothetical protein